MNWFDTAASYSLGDSETILGDAMGKLASRDSFVLSTKAPKRSDLHSQSPGALKRGFIRDIDSSLRRLGADHIDLYSIHQWTNRADEQLEAMDEIVRTGRARYIGVPAEQPVDPTANETLRSMRHVVAAQATINLLEGDLDEAVVTSLRSRSVSIVAVSPLGRGVLSGVPRAMSARGRTDENASRYRSADATEKVAQTRHEAIQRGTSMARVALEWVLSRPYVTTTLIGATTAEQVVELLRNGESKPGSGSRDG